MNYERVKAGIREINRAYFNGDIVYPRVDNSYFGSVYNYFAHPDLKVVNDYYLPLSKESYEVNKDTILLYLGHKGLITSSTILSISKFLETTFNDNLTPINSKYINSTIDKFLDFLSSNNYNLEKYISSKTKFHTNKFIYSIRLKPTLTTRNANNEKELKKSEGDYKSIKKSINSDVFKDENKVITYENDFFEGLEKFKKKRKLMRLREKFC